MKASYLRALHIAIALFACHVAGAVHGACPERQDVLDFVTNYINRTPAKALRGIKTPGDAQCAQGIVAAELARHMGNMAGFKIGFAHTEAKQRYNVQGPLRAFLFTKMFLENGASVAADYGARPLVEASLIAVVKDGQLQDAATPLEALQHISHFLPYIELNDLALGQDESLNDLTLTATNVGTRMGVIGEPIAVEATEAFLAQLAAMQVVVTDAAGRELGRGEGRMLLEHPINSVLWLARGLAYDGMRIIEGDRLALGAFTAGTTPAAGSGVQVQYFGLPGDPRVSVSFK